MMIFRSMLLCLMWTFGQDLQAKFPLQPPSLLLHQGLHPQISFLKQSMNFHVITSM
jgi:hypothetical protein